MGTPAALIGHEAVLARLLEAHRQGGLAHALLLTGPSGVGKTTLATELAAAVLDGREWPGGLQAHPDLWCEDSAAERIGIGRIRAGARAEDGPSLQDVTSMRTYAGGMRVAVLGRADRLTEDAADALLKTLEEPPDGTLIILCAANPEALPETVVSRTQQTALTIVEASRIASWLEGAAVEPRLARLAAGLAGGRPGRALRLASQPGLLAAEVEGLHAFLAIAGSGMDGALRAAADLAPGAGAGAEGRERALLLLAVWSSFVRDAALEALAVDELRLWSDYSAPLERWAESLGAARLTEILGLLLRARGDIARYAQPRLTLEALFLDIFVVPAAPPPVPLPVPPPGFTDAPAAVAAMPDRKPGAKRAGRR